MLRYDQSLVNALPFFSSQWNALGKFIETNGAAPKEEDKDKETEQVDGITTPTREKRADTMSPGCAQQ